MNSRAPESFRHCEFRHLMVRMDTPLFLVDQIGPWYYGHLHESEAFECAWYERQGWPSQGLVSA